MSCLYSISTFKFIITYRSQDEESENICDNNISSSASGSRSPDDKPFVIAELVIIFNILNITIIYILIFYILLIMVIYNNDI